MPAAFTLDLFTILPLVCALFVAFFAGLILFSTDRNSLHRLLAAFCGSMFMWMFGTFMMFGYRISNPAASEFWDRFVYTGVVWMPPLMHHFSLLFTEQKKQRAWLYINYVLAIFFLFAAWTPWFVSGLNIYSWGAHTKAQILHHLFLGYFFAGTGVFFINMLRVFLRSKDAVLRKQVQLIFSAFAIVIFVGGSAYLYAYGIDTRFPFAYFSGLVFPIMLFYATSRYHFLGTKVIATEVLVGSAAFLLLTQIFLARNMLDIILQTVFALVMLVVGFALIRSVRFEVDQRGAAEQLADKLQKANDRLQDLDKMKTEFVSIASHQLRTPLSIIKGYVSLIQDGAYGKTTKKMNPILDNIASSNERLVKLVDEFLDVSRLEQGRTTYTFSHMRVQAIVESVVNEVQERADEKHIKVERHFFIPRVEATVDEERIRHSVQNFFDNAIKYSPEKSTIVLSLQEENKGIAFRVKDTGVGLDSTDKENLFQKFYRSGRVIRDFQGSGLGLYVVKEFIEAHGGRVWAQSDGPKKGSEFGFWVPIIPPAQMLEAGSSRQ